MKGFGTRFLSPCPSLWEGLDMPRNARKKSETGIYHIMLRGINRQRIFEEANDKEKLFETIMYYKEICQYKI